MPTYSKYLKKTFRSNVTIITAFWCF